MNFPAGRYRVIEGIEIKPSDVLDVDGPFVFVYGRPCRSWDGDKASLIALLVGEKVIIKVVRNGKAKQYG